MLNRKGCRYCEGKGYILSAKDEKEFDAFWELTENSYPYADDAYAAYAKRYGEDVLIKLPCPRCSENVKEE